jgi:hypothetical protein
MRAMGWQDKRVKTQSKQDEKGQNQCLTEG